MMIRSNLFLIVLFFTAALTVQAKVTLPRFFSENMVLQREKPICLWGDASPKEQVLVSFNGMERKTTADSRGKWKTGFPAMAAGGPFVLEVKGKGNTIQYKNILVGDVWVCSGQSNMEFNLSGDLTAQEAVKNAANPKIRLLTIPKVIQTSEQTDIESGEWVECNSSTASFFSAVGYFFGKKLQEELNVPVGLINSSWGGTDIETWTSWEASMANPDYAKFQGKSVESAIGFTMDDVKRYKAALENDPGLVAKWFDPAQKLDGWKQMYVPKAWDGNLGNEDGIVWFKKEIDLPANVTGLDAALQLGAIDDEDITWVNGKQVGSMNLWIANRNYKLEPGLLKAGKNTIVVRVRDNSSVGGMFSEADKLYLEVGGTKYPLAGNWDYKPSVLSSEFGFKNFGTSPNAFATLLYNGMIHPLVGLGIKGVIWYQGENNAGRAHKYRSLFPNLINDWRKQWGYDFPFLWVQLASFMAEDNQPTDSEWAELREAQNMTLRLPQTGQAVITDLGDAFDIHPRNKKDVGLRLAHTAMNVAYGKDVLSSGPVFEQVKRVGNTLILSFSKTGTGLATSNKSKYGYVNGFAIAGKDRKFVWAKAYIKSPAEVVVFSDQVAEPEAVRYGWGNNPMDINLINSENLLASPFRTDVWKGITEGK